MKGNNMLRSLRWIAPTLVAVVAPSAALATTASTTATKTCAARMIQGSHETVDVNPIMAEPVWAGDRVRILVRCKSGVGLYQTRVCVRHPGNVVRCRNVKSRNDNWGSFVFRTSTTRWTYRVSLAPRAGASVALKFGFRTHYVP